ncbi:hypothetical protein BU17DRAFT_68158 [Hysterangium stoloniferum]|nr:hypothetical protein BU17DRAFT_68158 [Hysterangium stoloniferum]
MTSSGLLVQSLSLTYLHLLGGNLTARSYLVGRLEVKTIEASRNHLELLILTDTPLIKSGTAYLPQRSNTALNCVVLYLDINDLFFKLSSAEIIDACGVHLPEQIAPVTLSVNFWRSWVEMNDSIGETHISLEKVK